MHTPFVPNSWALLLLLLLLLGPAPAIAIALALSLPHLSTQLFPPSHLLSHSTLPSVLHSVDMPYFFLLSYPLAPPTPSLPSLLTSFLPFYTIQVLGIDRVRGKQGHNQRGFLLF